MFKLGRLEHTRPHLLADAAEAIVAFTDRESVSFDDLCGWISQSPKSAEESLGIEEPDVDDDGEPDSLDSIEINARIQACVEEAFRQLTFRLSNFAGSYPFQVEGQVLLLKRDLDHMHQVYLYLLAASRIRSFAVKGAKQRIADGFETICHYCLSKLMPPLASTYMFGPNSIDRRDMFKANLLEALPILADKIGIRLNSGWKKNFSTSGDGGIDLVSVLQLDDCAPGWHVLIGQCAAVEDEKDWNKKRMEAQLCFRAASFSYQVMPQPILFIPVCFRQPDGSWVNEDYVSGVTTLDRLRIMRVLAANEFPEQDIGALYGAAGISICQV